MIKGIPGTGGLYNDCNQGASQFTGVFRGLVEPVLSANPRPPTHDTSGGILQPCVATKSNLLVWRTLRRCL